MYTNFLILSVATTILLSNTLSQQQHYLSYASDLMKHFVMNCRDLYGDGFESLNVHFLLHLSSEVKIFGMLDNCSAFPFEIYLQQLKKMIRKSLQTLQQVIHRLSDRKSVTIVQDEIEKSNQVCFSQEHSDGPLLQKLNNPQYKKNDS